jgi:hypothetical protein
MSEIGKTHIVIMWTVGPDDVAEGDRIFDTAESYVARSSRLAD